MLSGFDVGAFERACEDQLLRRADEWMGRGDADDDEPDGSDDRRWEKEDGDERL